MPWGGARNFRERRLFHSREVGAAENLTRTPDSTPARRPTAWNRAQKRSARSERAEAPDSAQEAREIGTTNMSRGAPSALSFLRFPALSPSTSIRASTESDTRT